MATAGPPVYDTLADMLRSLGVPPRRVVWKPYPGTATEKDLRQLLDGEPKRLIELVDGVLVEKATGYPESMLALSLALALGNFNRTRRLGLLAGADGPMRLAAGLVRLPDISFTRWENIPPDGGHLVSIADYPPDLAVEVVSKGDTRREVRRKVREYFAAGVSLVWVIHPKTRSADVYTGPTAVTVLTSKDYLDGGAVLPGFRLRLADLFAGIEAPGKS